MIAVWIEGAGLLAGLAVLIALALRGVNIILASVLCSLIVILTNGMPLADGLLGDYTSSKLGAFTFAGNFFFLFAAGAMFGRVMGETHAATSIAMALVRCIGAHRALWITTLSSAFLTYGGVVAFVVIFAIYPLGLRLLKEADIPKRLFCGALGLGAGTFTMTALPGTPSIHNVIASTAFGTNLFAGAWLGIFGGSLMFAMGMWYLERERVKAKSAGEHFAPNARDRIPDLQDIAEDLLPWQIATLPLLAVIGAIIFPRLLTMAGIGTGNPVLSFALTEPILWPSFALVLGCGLALTICAIGRRDPLRLLGEGMQDSIVPLLNTAAVIGFGSVIVKTAGFARFTRTLMDLDIHPLLSMFAAVSTISAITGSAVASLQIFAESMADRYLAIGIDPHELHRIVVMSSGGAALPHSGAVIAALSVVGLTHRQGYKDLGIVCVIVPLLATLATIGIAILV